MNSPFRFTTAGCVFMVMRIKMMDWERIHFLLVNM